MIQTIFLYIFNVLGNFFLIACIIKHKPHIKIMSLLLFKQWLIFLNLDANFALFLLNIFTSNVCYMFTIEECCIIFPI